MVEKLEKTQRRLWGNVMVRTKFNVLSNFFLNFGFALGYLMWPLQGQVLTSCLQRLDCDHAFKHMCVAHRFW